MQSIRGEGSSLDDFFTVVIYSFVILFAIVSFIPFWLVLINSFAAERSIQLDGFQLLPSEFSLYSYRFVFQGKQIYTSYGVTLLVTGLGTTVGTLVTAMYAYVLSHRKVKYRNALSFFTYFTMLFGPGLVGFYILIAKWLSLKDTIWALILPSLLNPFYAFILVSFFRTLPYEIGEAATMDGANDIHIFFKVIWPISTPAVSTIVLFIALQYWNDWFLALLFIDNYKLNPLQMMLRQLISGVNASLYVRGGNTNCLIAVPTKSMQLVIVCVTIGPIVLLYPFVQRYFVKGITIGSVKG